MAHDAMAGGDDDGGRDEHRGTGGAAVDDQRTRVWVAVAVELAVRDRGGRGGESTQCRDDKDEDAEETSHRSPFEEGVAPGTPHVARSRPPGEQRGLALEEAVLPELR